MKGLEILIWAAGVALVIMLGFVVATLILGLVRMCSRRGDDFYDRVENAISKRDSKRR